MPRTAREFKRVNVNLPPDKFDKLQEVARANHCDMTYIIGIGITLAEYALNAKKNNQRLLLVGPQENQARELILAT